MHPVSGKSQWKVRLGHPLGSYKTCCWYVPMHLLFAAMGIWTFGGHMWMPSSVLIPAARLMVSANLQSKKLRGRPQSPARNLPPALQRLDHGQGFAVWHQRARSFSHSASVCATGVAQACAQNTTPAGKVRARQSSGGSSRVLIFRLANVGVASTANIPMRSLPLSDYALLLVRLLIKLICLCPSAILSRARLWLSCPSVPVCHAVQPGIHVAITDGGGNGSTAAWLVPQAHHDTLQPLRQKFLRLVADWGVLSRLETISASGSKDETSLFSSHEMEKLQESLVEFLCDQGYSCSTAVPAYQPFLLDAWCAVCPLAFFLPFLTQASGTRCLRTKTLMWAICKLIHSRGKVLKTTPS